MPIRPFAIQYSMHSLPSFLRSDGDLHTNVMCIGVGLPDSPAVF